MNQYPYWQRQTAGQPLFPDIEPYDTGFLQVSRLHRMYYEQCGNPDGKPVVFLHGGPGAGCNANCRRFFDPAHYRIVLFDQRGSGRSTPNAELTDNGKRIMAIMTTSQIEKLF